jgi:hypothetical protein
MSIISSPRALAFSSTQWIKGLTHFLGSFYLQHTEILWSAQGHDSRDRLKPVCNFILSSAVFCEFHLNDHKLQNDKSTERILHQHSFLPFFLLAKFMCYPALNTNVTNLPADIHVHYWKTVGTFCKKSQALSYKCADRPKESLGKPACDPRVSLGGCGLVWHPLEHPDVEYHKTKYKFRGQQGL